MAIVGKVLDIIHYVMAMADLLKYITKEVMAMLIQVQMELIGLLQNKLSDST